MPVIAMGDFNFDYNFATQAGNAAFTEFLSDDTWKWVRPAIRKVLDDQVAAWNAADLDRFMRHYWKSDQLTFSSEGQTQRGWTATMQRYQDRYPTPEKMGQLRFSELEVQPLGPTAALVLGQWHLTRSDEQLEGNFSLVFGQIEGRWQIMHDHTSLVRGGD